MRHERVSYDVESWQFEKDLFELSKSRECDYSTLKRKLRQAIQNELTEKQLQLVELYYFGSKKITQKEIAEITGKDASTVSRTLKRARKNLKRVLKYLI